MPDVAASIVVEISNTQNRLPVDPAWVERVVVATLTLEAIERASLSIALTDDASIRVINARFLSHDWATDVISFDFSEPDSGEFTGELIVSVEMAVVTAAAAQSDPLAELALYLVHGLLHLCGYDDQAAVDTALIRSRETAVLTSLGLENPFSRVGPIPATTDDSGRESVRWPRQV